MCVDNTIKSRLNLIALHFGGVKNTEKNRELSLGDIFRFFVIICALSILYIDKYWLGNILGLLSLFPLMVLWILLFYYISENLPNKILKYLKEKKYLELSELSKDILFYCLMGMIVFVLSILAFLLLGILGIVVFGGPLSVGYILIVINEINHRWKNRKKKN